MHSSVSQINDTIIDFLMSKTTETAEYDFKYLINMSRDSDFVKIAEDIFAMANYGGGYLLFGFKEKEDKAGYIPMGLPANYHMDNADIQRKFNSYSNESITLNYEEFLRVIKIDSELVERRFSILCVPPGPRVLSPIKDGVYTDGKGKTKFAFRDKDILIRRDSITDRATLNEIEWIKKRVEDTNYKIHLIGGEPDKLVENIYSNMFELKELPNFIYECVIYNKSDIKKLRKITRDNNIAIVERNDFIYSLVSLDSSSYNDLLYNHTHNTISTKEFIENDDNNIIFKWLLNNEIGLYMLKNGFRYDGKYKDTYFYSIEKKFKDKQVTWKSRYRTATRFVVRYSYEPKLGKSVYKHDAAEIRFTDIGNKYYLVIKPRLVISDDGLNAIHDSNQGPIITRLLHDEYNDKYLYNVLFWVSRLNENNDDAFKLNNRVDISCLPIILEFIYGIRYDRPKREFKDREEEMYMVGEQ